jgi:hypothetical protein
MQARLKLCSWPLLPGDEPPLTIDGGASADASSGAAPTLKPSSLAGQGVLLALRLTAQHLDSDSIVMPADAVIKVPIELASHSGFTLTVEGPGASKHSVFVAATDAESGGGADAGAGALGAGHGGEARPWAIAGLQALLDESGCGEGDEVGLQKCAATRSLSWLDPCPCKHLSGSASDVCVALPACVQGRHATRTCRCVDKKRCVVSCLQQIVCSCAGRATSCAFTAFPPRRCRCTPANGRCRRCRPTPRAATCSARATRAA